MIERTTYAEVLFASDRALLPGHGWRRVTSVERLGETGVRIRFAPLLGEMPYVNLRNDTRVTIRLGE